MNDLEHDLRDLLETKSREGEIGAMPAPKVLRRARRRQLGTVITALVGTVAVIAVSIVGLQALTSARYEPRPGRTPVVEVGDSTLVLPFGTIEPPPAWTVVVRGDVAANEATEVLQLTNFEPSEGSCFDGGIPPLGAVLTVDRLPGGAEQADPTWPVTLAESGSGTSACPGAQEDVFGPPIPLSAVWRDGSTRFVASASIGEEAPAEVRRLLEAAFASLRVTDAGPLLVPFEGARSVLLDSIDTPMGPVTLYGYRDDFEGGTTWIGIAGPVESGLVGAASIGEETPGGDEDVTMILDTWGGVVWGDVSTEAARAELRTVEGLTFPAELLALPTDLAAEGHQAVWGVVEGETADRVTTMLFDAEGNTINDHFPTGPRVVIGTGTDPQGGPWELYLEGTSDGTGLGFRFRNGGGGGGCCLTSLEGDFRLDGFGSGGDEPSNITALASDAVSRVVFQTSSGAAIEGDLYPVPDASLGIPQVALVLVPADVALEGDLVAFDASGNEVGREEITQTHEEPEGPTPEIDAVWQMLRKAREAVTLWANAHGRSLEDLTIEGVSASGHEIAWNISGPGKTVPGEVSLRGLAPAGGSELTGLSGWTVVLVSVTPDLANTYCIAVNIDEGGGGNFRYGTQDAANYQECRGGW